MFGFFNGIDDCSRKSDFIDQCINSNNFVGKFPLYGNGNGNGNDHNYKPNLFEGPDFTPDFSEKIDIRSDSINLALHTIGMGMSEYNSLNIQDLKLKKNISHSDTWAINILIHYKETVSLPHLKKRSLKLSDNLLKI